jgi:hypothetical protein
MPQFPANVRLLGRALNCRAARSVLLPLLLIGVTGRVAPAAPSQEESLRLRVSWGHQSPAGASFYLRFLTNELSVTEPAAQGFEPGDRGADGVFITKAGGGDIDAVECVLRYPARTITAITNLQRIWADLIAQSDPDTVRRLKEDPAYRPDPRKLTLQMDPEGTRGFSVTVDQLLRNRAFWVPALDVYLTAGDNPPSFAAHQRELQPWKGRRILDQVERGPEATYEEFKARWQDMGDPAYKNPAQTGPGQTVCLTWDSALHKFGIDRGAGVWNDYGNSDRFHVWLDFAEVTRDLSAVWKGQALAEGFPVITTRLENGGLEYEVEQLAYPLDGPPQERRGDIRMVLLEKITLKNPSDQPVSTSLRLRHRRLLSDSARLQLAAVGDAFLLEDIESDSVLLALRGSGAEARLQSVAGPERGRQDPPHTAWQTVEIVLRPEVPAHGSRRFILRLPSPAVPSEDEEKLTGLEDRAARQEVLGFWAGYLDRGARFEVPEPAVNELFRANLWHALRLPRRHGGSGPGVKIDLPYSNFAYDQHGTPWPVNQAVYVDYMLYDLRGYPRLSAEELRAIYRNNQEPNGHVGGFANWGVYTPGMIYAAANNYLLSGDRAALERLLPQTLKALDWCLVQIREGRERSGPSSGLVRAPLNDGTGDGIWAFNQAYFYAALDLLGKALQQIGHPRAQECAHAAADFRRSVERGFGAASMLSPLVPLRDHTWTPYVPCEALTPHRLLQQWYPTDVDTGATHLPRLKALAPDGWLTDALLQDHEDNLYLHGWGMANEPVYNQQATAYLLRDNPKAAIRAFYSMMACAFSHSVFEPVEHRWTWGQFFGPPSTDGAWFDLYRHMLIQERDDDSLLLLQATPRQWLETGKSISIQRAPTFYGLLSLTVTSEAASGKLIAEIDMPDRRRPRALLLRLRHPQGRPMRSVTVNGGVWTNFDPGREWVRIPEPASKRYSIVATY